MDFEKIWSLIHEQLTPEHLVLALIPTLIVAVLKSLGFRIIKNLRRAVGAITAMLLALPRYLQLLHFVQSAEKPIWEYRKFGKVELRDIPPVITIMNFKGGVGKTTIAANVAACLSLKHNKKVLLIDLDYQGSLSSELIPEDTNISKFGNTIGKWLASATAPAKPEDDFITPDDLPKIRLLTADYDLSDIEDNQLQRWLLKDRTNGDIRSRLARYIRANKGKPDCDFDIIIMDAPPRLSLAAANAVRASAMILIPTRLQFLSAQPIRKMLNRLQTFKSKSGGSFKVGGVIGNFTNSRSKPSGKEAVSIETIKEALAGHPDDPVIFDTLIPNTPDIGSADTRPAYLSKKSGPNAPEPIFDALTTEILKRLNVILLQR